MKIKIYYYYDSTTSKSDRNERQAIGKVISPQDAWIAATAIRHNLPLVTNNAKDFQNLVKLQVITIQ